MRGAIGLERLKDCWTLPCSDGSSGVPHKSGQFFIRMLKQSATFVLGSSKSSTYPTWETSCLGSSGWAGKESYASGFDSPAALLDELFEHPAGT